MQWGKQLLRSRWRVVDASWQDLTHSNKGDVNEQVTQQPDPDATRTFLSLRWPTKKNIKQTSWTKTYKMSEKRRQRRSRAHPLHKDISSASERGMRGCRGSSSPCASAPSAAAAVPGAGRKTTGELEDAGNKAAGLGRSVTVPSEPEGVISGGDALLVAAGAATAEPCTLSRSLPAGMNAHGSSRLLSFRYSVMALIRAKRKSSMLMCKRASQAIRTVNCWSTTCLLQRAFERR